MKREDLEKITSSMQSKLTEEQSALIADDIATILLDNTAMNTEIETHKNNISKLEKDKEQLIMTNNRLFQQVAVGSEEIKEEKQEQKPFSFKSVFDEKGNFIN